MRGSRHDRDRSVIAGAVVLAVALLAACTGSSNARHTSSTTRPARTTTSTSTTTTPRPEGWRAIADAPTALGLYGVWTGTEYIGGPAGCCDDLGGTEVVAYSPASNSWRSLAAWPLPQRSSAAAVWTGKEMVVVGGLEGVGPRPLVSTAVPSATGAALDPAKNTWRTIAPLPAPMASPRDATWTADRVVVFDDTHTYRYDPRADRWSTGAPPPFRRNGSVVVSTGRQVLVWSGSDAAAPGQAPPDPIVLHADGAEYDVARDRWSTIPAAPVPARANSVAVWTGRQMILWGGAGAGSAPGQQSPLGKGAAYDPATGKWHALPASPLKARDLYTMVWTGHEVLVWGGFVWRRTGDPRDDYARDGAAYDPATDTWRSMAPPPPSPPAPLNAFSAVWTGDTALFIGGSAFNAQGIGSLGLAYSPGR
jgi:N-acetylneuraminic acid mutarotase